MGQESTCGKSGVFVEVKMSIQDMKVRPGHNTKKIKRDCDA